MTGFRLARAAERDLQEIKDYVARGSIDAAARVLDRLGRAFLDLAEMPGLGHRREDLTSEDFRFWPVDYLVVYEPESRPLAIVRVLHGSRDVRRELEPE